MRFMPFICCGDRVSEEESSSVDKESPGARNVRKYSYRELRRATDDFSQLNKIGEGGFGSVYKGKLSCGRMVAVKVLSPESSQGWEEFLSEISTLAFIYHENLIQMYGFCSEKHHRILVYKYLPNRSLSQNLLGGGFHELKFDWKTRAKIVIGVAKGLVYLHEEVQPPMVHRDIKASNILLDEDLSPKIADFGLVKLLPSNTSYISTRVAGTIGYLAPEYAFKGKLTRKADVYSFGVLLLEIVSGRCNRNTHLPPGEQFLLSRAWEMYERGDLLSLVDCELNGEFDEEEVVRYMKVGLLCTQDNPRLRPPMQVVAKFLEGETDADMEKITKPGLVAEFLAVNIKSEANIKKKHEDNYGFSGTTLCSGTSPRNLSTNSSLYTSSIPRTSSAISDRE